MKQKFLKNKKFVRFVSLSLVVAILAGSYLFTIPGSSISFSYIEKLKSKYSEEGNTYTILEVVPAEDEGTMGYYVGGSEPDWTSVLASCNSETTRRAVVASLETAMKNAGNLGTDSTTPLTGKSANYKESYPWNRDDSHIHTVNLDQYENSASTVKGVVSPNTATGSYYMNYGYDYVGTGGDSDLNADCYIEFDRIGEAIHNDSFSYTEDTAAIHWHNLGYGIYTLSPSDEYAVVYNANTCYFTLDGKITNSGDSKTFDFVHVYFDNADNDWYSVNMADFTGTLNAGANSDNSVKNSGMVTCYLFDESTYNASGTSGKNQMPGSFTNQTRGKYFHFDARKENLGLVPFSANASHIGLRIGYWYDFKAGTSDTILDNYSFKLTLTEDDNPDIIYSKIFKSSTGTDAARWKKYSDNKFVYEKEATSGTDYIYYRDSKTFEFNGVPTSTTIPTVLNFTVPNSNNDPYIFSATYLGGDINGAAVAPVIDCTGSGAANGGGSLAGKFTYFTMFDESSIETTVKLSYNSSVANPKLSNFKYRCFLSLKQQDDVMPLLVENDSYISGDSHFSKKADGTFSRKVNGVTVTYNPATARFTFNGYPNAGANQTTPVLNFDLRSANFRPMSFVTSELRGRKNAGCVGQSITTFTKQGGTANTQTVITPTNAVQTLTADVCNNSMYNINTGFYYNGNTGLDYAFDNYSYKAQMFMTKADGSKYAENFTNIPDMIANPDNGWEKNDDGTYYWKLGSTYGLSVVFDPITEMFTVNGSIKKSYFSGDLCRFSLLNINVNNTKSKTYQLSYSVVSGSSTSDGETKTVPFSYFHQNNTFDATVMDANTLAGMKGSYSAGETGTTRWLDIMSNNTIQSQSTDTTVGVQFGLYCSWEDGKSGDLVYDNYKFHLSFEEVNTAADSDNQYYANVTFSPVEAYEDLATGTMIFVHDGERFVYDGTVGADGYELDVENTYYRLDRVNSVAYQKSDANPYVVIVSKLGDDAYVSQTAYTPGAFKKRQAAAIKYVGVGNGNVDFTPGNGEGALYYTISTNVIYCNDFYTNNEWFKRFAMDCTDSEVENTKVRVVCVTPDELNENPNRVLTADMVVFTTGIKRVKSGNTVTLSADTYSGKSDITRDVYFKVRDFAEAETQPVILDTAILNQAANGSNLWLLVMALGYNEFDFDSWADRITGVGAGGSFTVDTAYNTISICGNNTVRPLTQPNSKAFAGKTGVTYGTTMYYQNLGNVAGYAKNQIQMGSTYVYVNQKLVQAGSGVFSYDKFYNTPSSNVDVNFNFYVDDQNGSGNRNNANIQASYMSFFDLSKSGSVYTNSTKGRVKGSVYSFCSTDVSGCSFFATKQFNTPISGNTAQYNEVLEGIRTENTLRELKQSLGTDTDLMEERVSIATCVRWIMNNKGKRDANRKTDIDVLDIEPYIGVESKTDSATGTLTEEQVKKWIYGKTGRATTGSEIQDTDLTIKIDTMAAAEVVGSIKDIVETYDIVYIGTSTYNMKTKLVENNEVPDYNDDLMDGNYYTNIGDIFYCVNGFTALNSIGLKNARSDAVLAGFNGDDFYCYQYDSSIEATNSDFSAERQKTIKNINGDLSNVDNLQEASENYWLPTRSSGNDLTPRKLKELIEAADCDIPIVLSDDFFFQAYNFDLSVDLKYSNPNWQTGVCTVKAVLNGKERIPADVDVVYTWWYYVGDSVPSASQYSAAPVHTDTLSLTVENRMEYDLYAYCEVTLKPSGNKYRNMDRVIVKSPIFYRDYRTQIYAGFLVAEGQALYNTSNRLNYAVITRVDKNGASDTCVWRDTFSGITNNLNDTSLWGAADQNPYKNDTISFSWDYCHPTTVHPNSLRTKVDYWDYEWLGAGVTTQNFTHAGSKGRDYYKNLFGTKDIWCEEWSYKTRCNITINGTNYLLYCNSNSDGSKSFSIPGFWFQLKPDSGEYGATKTFQGSYERDNTSLDNASHMYEFLEKTYFNPDKSYFNVMTSSEAIANNGTFVNYLNLSTPIINVDASSVRVYDENQTTASGGKLKYNGLVDRTLTCKFNITNVSDVTPLTTTYDYHLFVDLNTDGVYADDEEINDYQIYRVKNGIKTRVYSGELKTNGYGEDYTYELNCQFPADYEGCVPWRLNIVKTDDETVHTSYVNYAYVEPESLTYLNVLQIINGSEGTKESDRKDSTATGTGKGVGSVFYDSVFAGDNIKGITRYTKSNISSADEKTKQAMNEAGISTLGDNEILLRIRDQYLIHLDVINMDGFGNLIYQSIQNASDPTKNWLTNKFLNYDMLICGFGDGYFNGVTEIEAYWITKYIELDKPVLYTHDGTSYYNSYVNSMDSISSTKLVDSGYYLNKHVRYQVGLDRYGASYIKNKLFFKLDPFGGDGTSDGYSGTNPGGFDRKYSGIYYNNDPQRLVSRWFKALTAGNNYQLRFKWVNVTNNGYDFSPKKMEEMGYDVAYLPGQNATASSASSTFVQGFTRHTMARFRMTWVEGDGTGSRCTDQYIPTLNGKYTTKGLEQTWYDNKKVTKRYMGQVDNNYWTYVQTDEALTKTTKITLSNSGQITSYPFNLNRDLTIQQTHDQYYQLNVDSEDTVCWFCLGGDKFEGTKSTGWDVKNDCANCYYLYSYGNVIYTGAGHTNDFTEDEAKLFMNVIVSSSTVNASLPEAEFRNEADTGTESYRVLGPSELLGAEDTKLYFVIRDLNQLGSPYADTGAIQLTYQDGDTTKTICSATSPVTVYFEENGVEYSVSSNTLEYGKTYYLKLPNDVKSMLANNDINELAITMQAIAYKREDTAKATPVMGKTGTITLRKLTHLELS